MIEAKTAWTIKGFIKAMEEDSVGWNQEVIGGVSYELWRLMERPTEIPGDKK